MENEIKENAKHSAHSVVSGFSGLGIAPSLIEALGRIGHVTPTPIQRQAIPVALAGKDVVGIAQTGTGKTFAFGIPMIQRLAQIKGRGLVILPTRELAIQVDEALRQISKSINLRTAVLIGGAELRAQTRALARNPHVIVATPGRLIDHINKKSFQLDSVRIVVLDEADRMLDMGFAPQIEKILRAIPKDRQTMLFSATMPAGIMKIATAHMKLPIRVEVAPSGTTVERVTQEIFVIHKENKNRLLDKLLDQHLVSTLIFTRTKHGAKRLVRRIRAMGHNAAEIHSNRTLAQRREALDGFKSGKYRVLVATDIASRGIDVVGIGLVVNFDMPNDPGDYVHRIGRTARAGAGGHAISFVTPEQRGEIHRIERLIRRSIPISHAPELPQDRPLIQEVRPHRRPTRQFHQKYAGARRQ
ncbi:MAG: DEAD/DEAH box helicase [Candidatus Spechtbacterales bacterium]